MRKSITNYRRAKRFSLRNFSVQILIDRSQTECGGAIHNGRGSFADLGVGIRAKTRHDHRHGYAIDSERRRYRDQSSHKQSYEDRNRRLGEIRDQSSTRRVSLERGAAFRCEIR